MGAGPSADLIDSLYRGFPAGYFLFWDTSKSVDSHAIGVDNASPGHQKMIVDGQQRLTSLYAVMTGKSVLNDDNDAQQIRIAFNPLSETFEVANAATDKDPRYVANISTIWTSGKSSFDYINEFLAELENVHPLSPEERSKIGASLSQLNNINNYQFSVLVLASDMEIDTVAEVFQRINSKGIPLNSADFILTLMSVYWPEGRHQLEDFCNSAKKPSSDGSASAYNVFLAPSPDQMLRVAIGFGLKRGVLQNAYQILLGRDATDRKIKPELRDERFELFKDAQAKVLNLSDWHDYMNAVKAAGYRSSKMLTSANNFLYGYMLYLVGRHEFAVEKRALRNIMSRWFYMSSLSGRYTGSPETILEADLRRLENIPRKPEAFILQLQEVIDKQFTDDYWRVTLPDKLDTSSAWSPYLFGYHAALNLLDATALFSKLKISELLDPLVSTPKAPVERHHLFPKAFLKKQKYSGTYELNQVANFAFIEWYDNIKIGARDPAEYFPKYFAEFSDHENANALYWHALPDHWYDLEYWNFVEARRKLIAGVVKDGYAVLCGEDSPIGDRRADTPSVQELLATMETLRVEFKASARYAYDTQIPEKVINEGVVKTVAAFLNTEGGTLGIGISDDGDILGLAPDLAYKNQDLDAYQNWLNTLLINSIGDSTVARNVSMRFDSIDEHLLCLVDVRPGHAPAYAATTKGKDVFYVRSGNTTRVLTGAELVDYVAQRF